METDPISELSEIVTALRAHLEWQEELGAVGLPRDPGAKARVEADYAERGGLQVEAPVSPPGRLGAAREQSTASPAPQMQPPPSVSPGALSPRSLPVTLAELEAVVRGCTACALHTGRRQTVFARGTGSSGLCFVGEGPGADEDAQGAPFVGAAGQLLDKMIQAMGLGREEVYVCNIVKCRPPNNRRPEQAEMEACSGYLKSQLELVQPEIIVALGGTAVTGLLGVSDGITRIRGTFRLYDGRIPVMPTFHPAYLLRTPKAKADVWADLKLVLQQMGRAVPTR